MENFSFPLSTCSTTVGYVAPMFVQIKNKEELAEIIPFAEKVLHDPLLLQKLCDRVYELMLEDMRQQRTNNRQYGELF